MNKQQEESHHPSSNPNENPVLHKMVMSQTSKPNFLLKPVFIKMNKQQEERKHPSSHQGENPALQRTMKCSNVQHTTSSHQEERTNNIILLLILKRI